MYKNEMAVCGLPAIKAIFASRPERIRRLFYLPEMGKRVGIICGYMAANRLAYREVDAAQLEKLSETVHHHGVVAVVTMDRIERITPEILREWSHAAEPLVLLDRIANAHNLGAVVRSAAFFGIPHIVLSDAEGQALPGEAAHRVAQGGMEHVTLWRSPGPLAHFAKILAGTYAVIGADVRGQSIPATKLREQLQKISGRKPQAIVLGNEEKGLTPELAANCTALVKINGTGKMESLNVSAAAAVLFAAIAR